MQRAPRISRAQVVALSIPQLAPTTEGIAAAIAIALLLLALLAP